MAGYPRALPKRRQGASAYPHAKLGAEWLKIVKSQSTIINGIYTKRGSR